MGTSLEFVRDTIYQLRREYAVRAVLYRVETATTNAETGKQTFARSVRGISAIMLPSTLMRTFTYDLAFISANKNFTVGGFYDLNKRVVLIDRAELGDFEPRLDDYLVLRGAKWGVKQVEFSDEAEAYVVAIQELKGTPVTQIAERRATSILSLGSEVSHG